ncbi:hypothetical protein HNP32_003452 [Brevundimonas bullata]|uniref:Uncharacterized protein n=1 Tax=Brevundimonas bullata TaxID=13160 RepID=A0A7W7IT19_9CAUL|nr:hypothetical protein [Brevundimonas bullata]MBB4799692.1 hypothetical protein [Brevundimonas bullata]MBB6384686.1 hypothetical protein [Brevundimonas bullata]
MQRKTIYCTQTFARIDGRIVPMNRRQHLNAERAMRAASILAQRKAGVAVFSLDGVPSVDHARSSPGFSRQ